MNFWLTIEVPTIDIVTAERIANRIATKYQGTIINVQQEPPQGATIVGDMREDG